MVGQRIRGNIYFDDVTYYRIHLFVLLHHLQQIKTKFNNVYSTASMKEAKTRCHQANPLYVDGLGYISFSRLQMREGEEIYSVYIHQMAQMTHEDV